MSVGFGGDRQRTEAARALAGGAFSAGGGAVAIVLAAHRAVQALASGVEHALGEHGGRWAGPYYGFLLAAILALGGAAGGWRLFVESAKRGRAWVAPAAVIALDAIVGGICAPWLAIAAPVAALALGALLVTGRGREGSREVEPLASIACAGGCAASALWFPLARDLPASFVLLVSLGALVPALAAAGATRTARDRIANALVPLFALPLVGLERNPGFVPLALAATLALLLYLRPAWAARLGGARIVLAMVGFAMLWVLPWGFRDMPIADQAGHESQHLGWLNAMSFGKLMMADSGFTYGPLREYAIAASAWLFGGIRLDHVRLAHVVMNLGGLAAIVYCMRRVCRGRTDVLFLGTVLVITHSPIASFLAYTHTYSFGWADEMRAGLATLALVVTIERDRPRLGGAIAAAAVLYSHDFGLPAAAATLVAFVLHAKLPGETRRSARRRARDWAIGFACVIGPFLAVYAACGKLVAFFAGYAWTVRMIGAMPGGATPYDGSWASFASLGALIGPRAWDNALGLRVLENFAGPSIVVAGFAHALVARARRRFDRRALLVLSLALLAAMTLRHAFMLDDVFHMLNAQTPALVLLVALMANARRVPFATLGAAIMPIFWLASGAALPFEHRLARMAAGEERPSFGPPYHYGDLPRAGDERVTEQHLAPVRWIRAHTRPTDAVLVSIWPISGGTEAFLARRRNPTSFVKPDELVTDGLHHRIAEELTRDPPVLVVASDLHGLGDEAERFVRDNYREEQVDRLSMWMLNSTSPAGSRSRATGSRR